MSDISYGPLIRSPCLNGSMRTAKKTCSNQKASQKLPATRWTVCADCFRRIIDNYASFYKLWLSCLSQSLETDIKSRVIGCKSQIEKFEFYFALHLSHKLYALTDNLSKTLQSHKISALSGTRNAELTKKTFETMRNDESFVLFFFMKQRLERLKSMILSRSQAWVESREKNQIIQYFSTWMETHQVWQIAHMLQLKTTFGESTLKPLMA